MDAGHEIRDFRREMIRLTYVKLSSIPHQIFLKASDDSITPYSSTIV